MDFNYCICLLFFVYFKCRVEYDTRLLHIRRDMCRWCCWCHWDLRDMWLHICVILRHKWMSGQISRLCRCHERMRNPEEPLHVIGCTLSWHNTKLPRYCRIVRVMHPLVINIFKWNMELVVCGGMVWTYPNFCTTFSGWCLMTTRPIVDDLKSMKSNQTPTLHNAHCKASNKHQQLSVHLDVSGTSMLIMTSKKPS